MRPTSDIGAALRRLRKSNGESLIQLASAIEIDRAYLNKVELGTIKPSPKLLDKIIDHFSVEGNEAKSLRQIAGHEPYQVAYPDGRKEEENMQKQPQPPVLAPQIAVNPIQTPVLYTDSTFVSSTEYGLVLDVAQLVGGQQHNIVARIGMSFDHAKKLAELILDNIEKNER